MTNGFAGAAPADPAKWARCTSSAAALARIDGLHSVSINLSYRITLELLIHDQQITPVTLGDHDAVY